MKTEVFPAGNLALTGGMPDRAYFTAAEEVEHGSRMKAEVVAAGKRVLTFCKVLRPEKIGVALTEGMPDCAYLMAEEVETGVV